MKEQTSITKSLYQCQELMNQIEADDGEVSEEQLKAIVELHTQSLEKLTSLCGFIRYLEHGIEACKGEKDRINRMQKTAENRLARVKQYVTPFVKSQGRINLDTVTLSVRKSISVELEPDFKNPYFCKVVKELIPDKRAIKEALKDQEKIKGARLVTNFNLQIK
ncbi:unnamed protein product [marine sediment metagenome]|uniref:Siphovirus Gp157 family protein n=1 Tax=marine sediment metagenome TaxID=412755 RepID=X1R7P1_9ZZZZ